MPPPAPVSSAWRPCSRCSPVMPIAPSMKGCTRALRGAQRLEQPALPASGPHSTGSRQNAASGSAAAKIGMRDGRVHALVLVGVGQLAAVPAAEEGEEQRRQHRDAGDARAARQALAQRRHDEARDLREAVHRDALVGVAQRRVAEALEHHVAVGRQVDRARVLGRVEAGDHVVGDVVEGHLPDRRVLHAFVDVAAGRPACRPRRCSCGWR